jgi:hypothetical protein
VFEPKFAPVVEPVAEPEPAPRPAAARPAAKPAPKPAAKLDPLPPPPRSEPLEPVFGGSLEAGPMPVPDVVTPAPAKKAAKKVAKKPAAKKQPAKKVAKKVAKKPADKAPAPEERFSKPAPKAPAATAAPPTPSKPPASTTVAAAALHQDPGSLVFDPSNLEPEPVVEDIPETPSRGARLTAADYSAWAERMKQKRDELKSEAAPPEEDVPAPSDEWSAEALFDYTE